MLGGFSAYSNQRSSRIARRKRRRPTIIEEITMIRTKRQRNNLVGWVFFLTVASTMTYYAGWATAGACLIGGFAFVGTMHVVHSWVCRGEK